MPLCPQITNTPITVSLTGDFTVTNVVPVLPANTEQLNEVIILADGKTKAFYQATAPTVGVSEGDIWFDTDDGNKQYYYNGTAWVSVQDTAIAAATSASIAATNAAAAAEDAAEAAQLTADGKNRIYRQTTMPTTGPFSEGDLWFDTDDDNRFYRYTSGAFSAFSLGNNAIASLSATKLTAGTIDASVITVSNINAGNISTGTLAADRILAASITGSKIAANTITAANITAGTITATEIATGTITAAKIATGTITATQIAGGTITAAEIAADTITAAEIAAGSITVDRLQAGTLTAFTLQTSTGNRRVTISASTNSIAFREAGVNVGFIGPTSIDGVIMHYGTSFNAGATAYPHSYVSAADARIAFSSTKYVEVSTTGVVVSGDLYSLTNFYNQDTTTTGNAANTWMSATNGLTRRSTASSQRYKENIVELRSIPELHPNKLLSLPVRAFTYKADYLNSEDDRAGLMLPGFIAEEVAEIYPIAADKDNGVIESWNDRFVVPGMLALIQDLHNRVETLEGEKNKPNNRT